ncbi:type IX secretion system membrane protein, PorP/SprF family [Pedobacter nyackensis]|uniref:Type IX secretion system membrane protein, PorP/SprF family n=2 Tax=Pedobacter nyackensis TaxID=475255 RepID=A0A1W2F8F1_9SPHI|nr:type IX secretion system membrane protein, PorP/SprF family [Pedobacter nyackensis]
MILLFSFVLILHANAQIKPLAAAFYQNQYLINPAMAGLEGGISFDLSYRKQLNSVPGALTEQALTGTYSFNKAAVGLNVYNERAGLLKRTRVVGSYAYHLKLNEEDKLHFGLSVGVLNEKVDESSIKGEATDVNIGRFNERGAVVDGDFGAAYTGKGMTVQGAILNLNNFLNRDKRNQINYSTFFTALSYKFNMGKEYGDVGLEPKLCYRGVKEADGILDAGVNVTFAQDRFNVFGLYHSSENATFGFGIKYKRLSLSGIYSSVPHAFSGYTNGDFELGLGIRL